MTGQCHPDRLNFSGRGNLYTCPQCNGSQVLVKRKQRRHPEECPASAAASRSEFRKNEPRSARLILPSLRSRTSVTLAGSVADQSV